VPQGNKDTTENGIIQLPTTYLLIGRFEDVSLGLFMEKVL
jgi:hypothetical protein